MPDTPNLLFILTDQQRYDSLRCYGNDWIQALALNRLAEQSFVFETPMLVNRSAHQPAPPL
jgi:arylsulfatase A-like enzyme